MSCSPASAPRTISRSPSNASLLLASPMAPASTQRASSRRSVVPVHITTREPPAARGATSASPVPSSSPRFRSRRVTAGRRRLPVSSTASAVGPVATVTSSPSRRSARARLSASSSWSSTMSTCRGLSSRACSVPTAASGSTSTSSPVPSQYSGATSGPRYRDLRPCGAIRPAVCPFAIPGPTSGPGRPQRRRREREGERAAPRTLGLDPEIAALVPHQPRGHVQTHGQVGARLGQGAPRRRRGAPSDPGHLLILTPAVDAQDDGPTVVLAAHRDRAPGRTAPGVVEELTHHLGRLGRGPHRHHVLRNLDSHRLALGHQVPDEGSDHLGQRERGPGTAVVDDEALEPVHPARQHAREPIALVVGEGVVVALEGQGRAFDGYEGRAQVMVAVPPAGAAELRARLVGAGGGLAVEGAGALRGAGAGARD